MPGEFEGVISSEVQLQELPRCTAAYENGWAGAECFTGAPCVRPGKLCRAGASGMSHHAETRAQPKTRAG